MRCLVLLSGGLDSLLAATLMRQQQLEVAAIHCFTPFAAGSVNAAAAAASISADLTIVDLADQYAEFLRRPRLGYIAGAAPCLDCRIAMLSAARERAQQADAAFVVTGDVVGQRPRTAIRDFEVVDHHAGLAGRVLRPLSAGLLPLTEPEAGGTVDRSRLLALHGKSRREQHRLAREWGIDPPPPRPDCPLLTEPLAARAIALVRSRQDIGRWSLELLSTGRQMAIDDETVLILGRNQAENERLIAAANRPDAPPIALVQPDGFPGPAALLVGTISDANLQRAAEQVARYSRLPAGPCFVSVRRGGEFLRIPTPTPDA